MVKAAGREGQVLDAGKVRAVAKGEVGAYWEGVP